MRLLRFADRFCAFYQAFLQRDLPGHGVPASREIISVAVEVHVVAELGFQQQIDQNDPIVFTALKCMLWRN